jgi:hypothetical protein
MPHTRLAVAFVLAATTLAASGCGGSSKATSTPAPATSAANTTSSTATEASVKPSGKPLSRSELIARADAICYRLNARRSATTIGRPQDYERVVPALASYELAAATEMGKLVPPASMAHDWQQIVAGSRTVAAATGRFHTYAEAKAGTLAHTIDLVLGKGIDELVHAAKRAGFKDCSHFA